MIGGMSSCRLIRRGVRARVRGRWDERVRRRRRLVMVMVKVMRARARRSRALRLSSRHRLLSKSRTHRGSKVRRRIASAASPDRETATCDRSQSVGWRRKKSGSGLLAFERRVGLLMRRLRVGRGMRGLALREEDVGTDTDVDTDMEVGVEVGVDMDVDMEVEVEMEMRVEAEV